MLNDTVAALLAGHAIAPVGKKYSSYIGLILGTGLNAAYIQPAREGIAKQIVVCESGKTKAVFGVVEIAPSTVIAFPLTLEIV